MKDLKEFILEANSKIDQWIAVSVTTAADSYHPKRDYYTKSCLYRNI